MRMHMGPVRASHKTSFVKSAPQATRQRYRRMFAIAGATLVIATGAVLVGKAAHETIMRPQYKPVYRNSPDITAEQAARALSGSKVAEYYCTTPDGETKKIDLGGISAAERPRYIGTNNCVPVPGGAR